MSLDPEEDEYDFQHPEGDGSHKAEIPSELVSSMASVLGITNLTQRVQLLEDQAAHVAMDLTAFSLNPSVSEVGSTVTSISFSWARNKVPASLTMDQGIGAITPPTLTAVAKTVSITTNTTYTLTASDGTSFPGNSDARSATAEFQRRIHWGTNAAESLNSAGILALANNRFGTSRQLSVTMDGGGEFLYFAYPASWGDASFTVGGLPTTGWIKTTVGHTNASGSTVNYFVYRSEYKQNGTNIQISIN